MKRDIFFKNHWQEISFNFLILLVFIIFYGRFGDVNVDSFREAYIPTQMLVGKTLYKDIFTIYSPLAYFINAFLYMIFGIHLKVLYIAGLVTTLGIANLGYKIANIFLEKQYSFSIILFFITTAVISPNVFNTIFPYSYGILYGLFFILLSLYFGLKSKFPLMYLFYSLAICSKYEFLLVLPLLIFLSKNKNWQKNIIAFLIPPIICFLILATQGVKFDDILTSMQLVLIMSSTTTLKWFYATMGYIFRWEHIPLYLINFVKFSVPVVLLTFCKKRWLVPIVFLYLYFVLNPASFIFAFPLITILFVIKYKQLNLNERFFILASLLISLKVYFAMTLQAYGVFFVLFALLPLLILCPSRFKQSLCATILICAIVFGMQNIKLLLEKNIELKTNRGMIKTIPYYGKSYEEILKYINTITSKNDVVLVYPEGLIVNFLTSRESDNKFYSLIPLYVETFGEELVKKRIELIKPKYIIITKYDTSHYYYSTFGEDYALNVMEFAKKMYKNVAENSENMIYSIYKRK